MKKSRIIGFIAFLAIIGLLVTACPKEPGDVQVTFNNVTANGSAKKTTTQLTLHFSHAIPVLTAAHINIDSDDVDNVDIGTLSGTGPNYTLGISGFTNGGTLNVSISASILGYSITGAARQVIIFYFECNCCVDCDDDCEGECCEDCECGTTDGGDECGVCGNDPCTCDTGGGDCGVCGNDPCTCDTGGGDECGVCGNDPCTCDTGGGDECGVCGNDPCTCDTGGGDNADIGIGDPSVKLLLNGTLVQGESTNINKDSGIHAISIAAGTYIEIIWCLNGNRVTASDDKISINLPSHTPGKYQITVEATPADGIKNSGSHSFVVH